MLGVQGCRITYRRSAAGAGGSAATDKPVSCNALLGGTLASLQKPSALEYRRHGLFDSRHPRRRLLGGGKVVEVTPLPPRRQRLEGALERWVPSEPLRQLLGNRK